MSRSAGIVLACTCPYPCWWPTPIRPTACHPMYRSCCTSPHPIQPTTCRDDRGALLRPLKLLPAEHDPQLVGTLEHLAADMGGRVSSLLSIFVQRVVLSMTASTQALNPRWNGTSWHYEVVPSPIPKGHAPARCAWGHGTHGQD